MELYILRHGIAEEGTSGRPDADRALTGEGKKKLRAILKLARDAQVNPSLIFTSPFRRAVESAQVAADVLGFEGEFVKSATLLPHGRPEPVWDELRPHADAPQILIAGHEPLLSQLTGFLLRSPGLEVDFKKGAMVRIDVERFGAEPRGVLKWMLVSKLTKAG
jgi:phosphohistidine phosphatase